MPGMPTDYSGIAIKLIMSQVVVKSPSIYYGQLFQYCFKQCIGNYPLHELPPAWLQVTGSVCEGVLQSNA